MKLYIEQKPVPWVFWSQQLWKQSSKLGDSVVVSKPSEATTLLVEWDESLESESLREKLPMWVFVEAIDSHQMQTFVDFIHNNKNTVGILVETYRLVELLKEQGLPAELWRKPSRVQEKLMYSDPMDILEKKNDFVMVSNTNRYPDNMAEIVKTYFGMYMRQGEDEKTIPDHEFQIFSAYDLPFDPFNNVVFNGLQPTPMMHKIIKASKLMMSPYNGNGCPMNVVDAMLLGTPVIMRDTEANRSLFLWDDSMFYKDTKDFAKKIKYFMDIPLTSEDYCGMIEKNFNELESFSVESSYNNLIRILKGN